jgi:germination protein M
MDKGVHNGLLTDRKRWMAITRMRITMLACVVALAVLGACSGDSDSPSEPPDAGSTEEPTPSEGPTADPSPAKEATDDVTNTVSFQVWFADGNRLAPAVATIEATPRVGAASLEALIKGPAGAGDLTSAVPSGTSVNSLSIKGGTATVDLSSEFESGSGIPSMGMRLGQLTFTLTQFPTVKRVILEVEGERVNEFSKEGLVIERPLTRADFEDISPAIIVDRPLGQSETGSPVTISGTANVFEANVSIRVVGSDGEVLAETFTTATCGTGCRGKFSEAVEFEVEEPTEATIQVYEESAKNGKPLNMIEVPVTLTP